MWGLGLPGLGSQLQNCVILGKSLHLEGSHTTWGRVKTQGQDALKGLGAVPRMEQHSLNTSSYYSYTMMWSLRSLRQPRNGDENGVSSTIPQSVLCAARTPGEATDRSTPYSLLLQKPRTPKACSLAPLPSSTERKWHHQPHVVRDASKKHSQGLPWGKGMDHSSGEVPCRCGHHFSNNPDLWKTSKSLKTQLQKITLNFSAQLFPKSTRDLLLIHLLNIYWTSTMCQALGLGTWEINRQWSSKGNNYK